MQRDLAKLAIAITLQQRNGGKVSVDFDDLEDRKDVSTFDVPKDTVGFLLGAKGVRHLPSSHCSAMLPGARVSAPTMMCAPSLGSTLRAMETKHRVFMFFNNERMRQGKHVRDAATRADTLGSCTL